MCGSAVGRAYKDGDYAILSARENAMGSYGEWLTALLVAVSLNALVHSQSRCSTLNTLCDLRKNCIYRLPLLGYNSPIMPDTDKLAEPLREFPIEVKVGCTKVTVTLLIAPHAAVTVKETKTEIGLELLERGDGEEVA